MTTTTAPELSTYRDGIRITWQGGEYAHATAAGEAEAYAVINMSDRGQLPPFTVQTLEDAADQDAPGLLEELEARRASRAAARAAGNKTPGQK